MLMTGNQVPVVVIRISDPSIIPYRYHIKLKCTIVSDIAEGTQTSNVRKFIELIRIPFSFSLHR